MSEPMSNRDNARGLLHELTERGLTEYGSVFNSTLVHHLLGIEYPDVAPKRVFDRLAMLELSAIDYCRNVLLGQGKYLAGVPSGYRVLLPSENRGQIDSYISSADKKLSRALKLSRNSPPSDNGQPNDQMEARIMMKQSQRHRGVPEARV